MDYQLYRGFSNSLMRGIYINDKASSERLLGAELVDGSMSSLSGPLLRFSMQTKR